MRPSEEGNHVHVVPSRASRARSHGAVRGRPRLAGRAQAATTAAELRLTGGKDYCNGTLVRVTEGSVTVRDLVRNRTVIIEAGRSYFAPTRQAR